MPSMLRMQRTSDYCHTLKLLVELSYVRYLGPQSALPSCRPKDLFSEHDTKQGIHTRLTTTCWRRFQPKDALAFNESDSRTLDNGPACGVASSRELRPRRGVFVNGRIGRRDRLLPGRFRRDDMLQRRRNSKSINRNTLDPGFH